MFHHLWLYPSKLSGVEHEICGGTINSIYTWLICSPLCWTHGPCSMRVMGKRKNCGEEPDVLQSQLFDMSIRTCTLLYFYSMRSTYFHHDTEPPHALSELLTVPGVHRWNDKGGRKQGRGVCRTVLGGVVRMHAYGATYSIYVKYVKGFTYHREGIGHPFHRTFR